MSEPTNAWTAYLAARGKAPVEMQHVFDAYLLGETTAAVDRAGPIAGAEWLQSLEAALSFVAWKADEHG